MRISIEGFKSIKTLKDFEFSPLTILAGVNSSGKSAVLQAILLLKQTFENNAEEYLWLNGPYVYADKLVDLVHGKNPGVIRYELTFEREELFPSVIDDMNLYISDVRELVFTVEFKANGIVKIPYVSLAIVGTENTYVFVLHRNDNDADYTFIRKYMSLDNEVLRQEIVDKCVPTFSNIFPLFLEFRDENDTILSLRGFKSMKMFLESYFGRMYFILPTRVSPGLTMKYNQTPQTHYIEPNGENMQYVYNEFKDKQLGCGRTLAEETNHWVYEEFGLAQLFDVKKDDNMLYHSELQMGKSLTVDLNQVGFGTSQILPVLVQGLLMGKDEWLIVEDPDVHMHPSVQAKLIDFFIAMAKEGKHIVVETHSDHMVTRLRRRVAECPAIRTMVQMCFVKMRESGSEYIRLDMTEQATFVNVLPEGFLDTQDEDFRAILKARIGR